MEPSNTYLTTEVCDISGRTIFIVRGKVLVEGHFPLSQRRHRTAEGQHVNMPEKVAGCRPASMASRVASISTNA